MSGLYQERWFSVIIQKAKLKCKKGNFLPQKIKDIMAMYSTYSILCIYPICTKRSVFFIWTSKMKRMGGNSLL